MLTSALYHPGVLINKYGVLALAWDDTQPLSCAEFGVDDDVDNGNVDASDERHTLALPLFPFTISRNIMLFYTLSITHPKKALIDCKPCYLLVKIPLGPS